MLASIMLCRLYGENDSQKFKLGWVPLLHQVHKGKIFNWAHILSTNIQQAVKKSQEAPPRFCQGFFMSGYLIDVVCAKTHFPMMCWNWSISQDPVHIYCSKLWAINCKNYFYEICDNFMIPLYILLKNQTAPRFTQEAMNAIKEIGDWFLDE
jgi:hypothetical protein